MPIITPEVAPHESPAPRLSPAADETTFGGGPGLNEQGARIQKVAEQTGDMAAMEIIRADQTAVEAARAKMSEESLNSLYDPKTGILQSKGLDALKAGEEGITNLKKNYNKIVDGLNGENQKAAASDVAIGLVENAQRQVMAHTDNQLSEYHKTAMTATVNSQAALAALASGDPKTIETSLKNASDAAEAYVVGQRLDKTSADLVRQESTDKVYMSVIEGMMKHQTGTQAQEFFDANKDKISPEIRVKISDAIKENSLQNQSLKLANEIWTSSKQDFSQAYDKTSEIKDVDLQKKTRAELKSLEADKRERFESHQMDLFQQGMNQLISAKSRGSKDPFDKLVGPMLSVQLEPSKYDALKKMWSNTETSSERWTNFNLMSPREMATITKDEIQTEWLPNFAPKDRVKAMSMWQRAQSNDTGSYVTHDQNVLIKQYAQNLGVAGLVPGRDPAKLKGDRAKAWMEFLDSGQQAVLNFETTKLEGKRKVTEEETKAVLDGIQLKMINQRSILGLKFGGKAIYESPYTIPREEIPETEKVKMTAFAQKLGKQATPKKMQQAYFFLKQGDVRQAKEILSN